MPRPPADAANTWGRALHATLFALAGAFQYTHIQLEVLQQHARLDAMESCPFEADFWAPFGLDVQSGVQSLSKPLTALEVREGFPDNAMTAEADSVCGARQVPAACTAATRPPFRCVRPLCERAAYNTISQMRRCRRRIAWPASARSRAYTMPS